MPKLSLLKRAGKVGFTKNPAAGAVAMPSFNINQYARNINDGTGSPYGQWNCVAMSENGSLQTAAGGYGIYTSSDFGDTWTFRSPIVGATVSMSLDGTIQALCGDVAGTSNQQRIYVSNDTGTTWTVTGPAFSGYWHTIKVSSNGARQTAHGSNGKIYVSTDYGLNWVELSTITQSILCLGVSSNGQVMSVSTANPGGAAPVYTSLDYGATWILRDSAGLTFTSIVLSIDGRHQLATESSQGRLYRSSDFGSTWIPTFLLSGLYTNRFISMSPSGTIQLGSMFMNDTANAYMSIDAGTTFNKIYNQQGLGPLRGIAMSSSGKVITAVGQYIFTARNNLNAPLMLPPTVTSYGQYLTAKVGEAFSYQIVATNSPTSYSISSIYGIPAGLSVNTSTGLISGTFTAPYQNNYITTSATNAVGTGEGQFYIAVQQIPPVITSSLTTVTRGLNSSFSYTVTASNSAYYYDASGLPPGVSINNYTGVISGTLTATGTYTVTISAINSAGTGTATLSIPVIAAPVITSSTNLTARIGTPFSYTVTATNNATSYSVDGPYPNGLSFSYANWTVSGTPTLSSVLPTSTQIGIRNWQITATNVAGTTTVNATLTVELLPIVTAATINVVALPPGSSSRFQAIEAYGYPAITSYSASNVPRGMTFSSNGISGVPIIPGTYAVTMSATNSLSTGSAILNVIAAANGSITPPVLGYIIAPVPYFAQFSYQVVPESGTAYQYNITNLPSNLSLNTETGVISGIMERTELELTGYVTNSGGSSSLGKILISPQVLQSGVSVPVVNSALSLTVYKNLPFSYQITATNNPTHYYATNLPSGFSVDRYTGVISGPASPSLSGVYYVKISASNEGGWGGWSTLQLAVGLFNGWELISSSKAGEWSSVSMSSSGQYQAVSYYDSNVYVSLDYGDTWTQAITGYFKVVKVSSDGVNIFAFDKNGPVYFSNDYGQTYTRVYNPVSSISWMDAAVPNSLAPIIAVSDFGRIYRSLNYGTNWSPVGPVSTSRWNSVDMSSDGVVMLASSSTLAFVYRSVDGGSSWSNITLPTIPNTVPRVLYSVAVSSTGLRMAVSDQYYVYTSSDGGSTWTIRYPGNAISSYTSNIDFSYGELSMSANGASIYLATKHGIFESLNYGAAWALATVNNAPTYGFRSITVSADGTKATAASRTMTDNLNTSRLYKMYK